MAQHLCKVPIMELSSGTIFKFFVNGLLTCRLSHKDESGFYYRQIPFKKGSDIHYSSGFRLHGCPLLVFVDRRGPEGYLPARLFDAILPFCSDDLLLRLSFTSILWRFPVCFGREWQRCIEVDM